MVPIPVSKFKMGCDPASAVQDARKKIVDGETQGECFKNAQPKHIVKFTHQFEMSTTEVTQALWRSVTNENPAYNKACGDRCPIEQVSWFDAIEFANRLSIAEGLPFCYIREGEKVRWPQGYACLGYRLPTEAEWEASARGIHERDEDDRGARRVQVYGWVKNNSDDITHPVGTKKSDTLGLYDMRGNVSEWVWDRFGQYEDKNFKNPKGPQKGKRRVIRGGSAFDGHNANRRIHRQHWLPEGRDVNIGFRLVRTTQPPG